jgi:exonuclease V gamma subunit
LSYIFILMAMRSIKIATSKLGPMGPMGDRPRFFLGVNINFLANPVSQFFIKLPLARSTRNECKEIEHILPEHLSRLSSNRQFTAKGLADLADSGEFRVAGTG